MRARNNVSDGSVPWDVTHQGVDSPGRRPTFYGREQLSCSLPVILLGVGEGVVEGLPLADVDRAGYAGVAKLALVKRHAAAAAKKGVK